MEQLHIPDPATDRQPPTGTDLDLPPPQSDRVQTGLGVGALFDVVTFRFENAAEARDWLAAARSEHVSVAVSDIADPDVRSREAAIVGEEFDRSLARVSHR